MGLGAIPRRTKEGHTAQALMNTGASLNNSKNETFLQLMMVEQLSALSAEEREFVETHKQIISFGNQAGRAFVELCRKLKSMRDGKIYRAAGFNSFEEYAEDAVGLKRRQVYRYLRVADTYPDSFLEENAGIGVTKLSLLASVTESEYSKIEDRLDLEKASASEVEKEVKKALAERDAAKEQVGLLDKEVKQLKADLTETEAARQSLQNAYEDEKKLFLSAKAREEDLKDQINNIKEELEAARNTVQVIKDDKAIKAAEARAEKLGKALLEVTAQLESFQSQNSNEHILFKVKLDDFERLGRELIDLLQTMEKKSALEGTNELKSVLHKLGLTQG